MSYIVVQKDGQSKPYTLTNAWDKPYISVKDEGLLPLTTETTTGLNIKAKVVSTTEEIERRTTTAIDSAGMIETTALTCESTSGTSYLTVESTTGTSYLTESVSCESSCTYVSKQTQYTVTILQSYEGIMTKTSNAYTSYMNGINGGNVSYTNVGVSLTNASSSSYRTQGVGNASSTSSTTKAINFAISFASLSNANGNVIQTTMRTGVYQGGSYTYTVKRDVKNSYMSVNVTTNDGGSINRSYTQSIVSVTNTSSAVTTGTSYLTAESTTGTSYLTCESTSAYSGVYEDRYTYTNEQIARALYYASASASDTYYTSAINSEGMSSVTALTRESTSSTSYLTRESTSGTSYGTETATKDRYVITHDVYTSYQKEVEQYNYGPYTLSSQNSTGRTFYITNIGSTSQSSSNTHNNRTSFNVSYKGQTMSSSYTSIQTVKNTTTLTNSRTYLSTVTNSGVSQLVVYEKLTGTQITSKNNSYTTQRECGWNEQSAWSKMLYTSKSYVHGHTAGPGYTYTDWVTKSQVTEIDLASTQILTTGTSYLTRESTYDTSYITCESTSAYSGVSSSSSGTSSWI